MALLRQAYIIDKYTKEAVAFTDTAMFPSGTAVRYKLASDGDGARYHEGVISHKLMPAQTLARLSSYAVPSGRFADNFTVVDVNRVSGKLVHNVSGDENRVGGSHTPQAKASAVRTRQTASAIPADVALTFPMR